MYVSIGSGEEKVSTSALHYISIPVQLYTDLLAYVDHYDTEVSGCGLVERVEHRFKSDVKDEPDDIEIEFAIRELYLPPKQDNSAGGTDIDEDTIAELLTSLVQQGKNTEHLRLHWHSHANMDTFHSGTDEDNYATLSHGDFLVSLVVNKAHKILGRVDYFKPLRITISGMSVQLLIGDGVQPSTEAVESIEKLDAYEKDKPSKFAYVSDVSTTKYSEYGYTGYDWDKDAATKTDDDELGIDEMEIARQLNIPIADARRYKKCTSTACHACKDGDTCDEFMYHVAGGKHWKGV